MTDLASRITQVKNQIQQAQHLSPHSPVNLLAVSKTRPISDIEAAYGLGLRSFGENYVQEGVEKVQALANFTHFENIDWHFIGPVQSNKTRQVAEHFSWVHTIDRLKIAQRLSDQRPSNLENLNVLIQVNISHQASKSGVMLAEVSELASLIANLPRLKLRGLMCIPAPNGEAKLKQDYQAMYYAYCSLRDKYAEVDTLSMGMSGDLETAIQSGSTLVRIGTAIFGPRTSQTTHEQKT